MLAKPGMARHLLGARARAPVGLDTEIKAWGTECGTPEAQPEVRAEDARAAAGAAVSTRPGERGMGRAHGAVTQAGSKFQILSTQVGQSLTQWKLRETLLKPGCQGAHPDRPQPPYSSGSFLKLSSALASPKGASRWSSLPLCPACRALPLGSVAVLPAAGPSSALSWSGQSNLPRPGLLVPYLQILDTQDHFLLGQINSIRSLLSAPLSHPAAVWPGHLRGKGFEHRPTDPTHPPRAPPTHLGSPAA